MVRAVLNRETSGRLVKFFVSFLGTENNELASVKYLSVQNADFERLVEAYNIREIADFSQISKSVTSWKAILRKVSNSLSKSNGFIQDMDAYFPVEEDPNGAPNENQNAREDAPEVEEEPEGAVGEEGQRHAVNEENLRKALRRMFIMYDPEENVAEKSLVPGIKEMARLLVQVEDHIIIKSSLAQALDARYAEFVRAKERVQDVSDLVKFGEISKDAGKTRCIEAMNSLNAVVEQAKSLFLTNPDEEIEGLVTRLLGDPKSAADFNDLLVVLSEDRASRLRVQRISPHLKSM